MANEKDKRKDYKVVQKIAKTVYSGKILENERAKKKEAKHSNKEDKQPPAISLHKGVQWFLQE